MKKQIVLTGKTLAAIGLLFLGLVLALAATVARGTDVGPVNPAAVAQTMLDETDHVTAGELARWIIEKRNDYQLVDIREPWQFDDYHIPTAVNVPLGQLFQAGGLNRLARGKTVVVYGLGAGHATETQLLLTMKGYKALSLKEGITAWWNDVMTPMSLRSATKSPAGYQQAKQLREHFMGGGTPASGSTSAPLPQLPPPESAPAQQNAPSQQKLKLGRGCS
jgi:rhodanese-related sulfurtransferase